MCRSVYKFFCGYGIEEVYDDDEQEHLLSRDYVNRNIESVQTKLCSVVEAITRSFDEFTGKMDEEIKVVQETIQDNNTNVEEEIHYLKRRVSKLEGFFDNLKRALVFKD